MVIGRPIILHNPSSTGRATLWWVYPPSKQTRRIKPQHQAWINKTGYIDNGIIKTHVCAVPLICAVALKCSRNYWQSLLSLFNCSGWGNPIIAVAYHRGDPIIAVAYHRGGLKNAVTLKPPLNITVLLARLSTRLSTAPLTAFTTVLLTAFRTVLLTAFRTVLLTAFRAVPLTAFPTVPLTAFSNCLYSGEAK